MSKIIIFSLISPLVLAVAFLLFFQGSPKSQGSLLFYSKTCPYCQKVDQFIKENKIEEKIKFERIDVNLNQQNSSLFLEKAAACKIPKNQVGVPLFWDGTKCFSGEQEIIDLFKIKLK